jgi:probable H4MPT-linked C1 transfer pathway protein
MPRLDEAVHEALPAIGAAPVHAITMTGEMVDLFSTRREGVAGLLGGLQRHLGQAALRVYAGSSGFLDVDRTGGAEAQIASANWHASATLVARLSEAALCIDVGSTTVDLAPVAAGRVLTRGGNDSERLVTGELLYTGVVRTPIMAIAREVPFAGDWVPLMAEHFATAADVYRLTGELPDGADQHPTADGREKTETASARRLARMVGRDLESAPVPEWRRLATWIAGVQRRRLEDACDRILSRGDVPDNAPLVGAGVGRFLLPALATRLGRAYLEFADLVHTRGGIRARVSDCAPAVAVAWLAHRSR